MLMISHYQGFTLISIVLVGNLTIKLSLFLLFQVFHLMDKVTMGLEEITHFT